MHIPPWVFVVIGVLVIVFGIWRIRLSRRTLEEDQAAKQRGGLYGVNRRTHLLIGCLYILLGVYLLVEAFGVRLLRFGK
jgi:uncharacterized membrane protein HdeD (DUF308 family)